MKFGAFLATPESKNPALSIVIPVLNDAPRLHALLGTLERLLPAAEIIVVDGGSHDLLRDELPGSVRWIRTEASRGKQLRRGAEMASAEWLWLVHADSVISERVVAELVGYLDKPGSRWGRFDVAIDQLPIVSWFANTRSALTGICTGDQGIFVSREALRSVGGVPDQPLMEDIELSRRLKRRGAPARLREPIVTSSRRWMNRGIAVCVLQMWWFRLRYWAGASPTALAADYYGAESASPPTGEQF